MRVKLLRNIAGAEGSFLAGSEADLSERMGQALVDAGYAEALDAVVPESDEPEAATLAPAETATRRNPKPRKAR